VAVAGLVGPGPRYGLEFTGGRLLAYETDRPSDLGRVRAALADRGLPRTIVQHSNEGALVVRTRALDASEEQDLEAALQAAAGPATKVRDEFVGPTIGAELRRRAVVALALALAAQLAYLAVRFRWTYGVAAVAAMFHDVVLLIGVFAWLGKEIDGLFLAALLTVIGYSINDSVVVFDRIREQRGLRPGDAMPDVVNDACLQTIPRTINTGLGAVFILAALWILGGDTLADFALALLIGIVAGTYSSVLTAAPLVVVLDRLRPGAPPRPPRKRAAPSRKRPGAQTNRAWLRPPIISMRTVLRVVWPGVVVAISACSGPVPTVDRVVVVNRTPYDVNVELRASNDSGWTLLGQARHDAETPFHEVVVQGDSWVVHFDYGGKDGGEITLSRRQLARNGWRIDVPEEVAGRLAEQGISPPP
jgi:preprotein translocase SecF subunit